MDGRQNVSNLIRGLERHRACRDKLLGTFMGNSFFLSSTLDVSSTYNLNCFVMVLGSLFAPLPYLCYLSCCVASLDVAFTCMCCTSDGTQGVERTLEPDFVRIVAIS